MKRLVRKRTHELNHELIDKQIAIVQSQKNEARLESLFEISKHKANTIGELMNYALVEALKLTESKLGILYEYVSKNNTLKLINLKHLGSENEFIFNEIIELQNIPFCVILNDYKKSHHINSCNECPYKQTLLCPLEKIADSNTLVIPVKEEDTLDAILLISKKKHPYDEADAKQLLLLIHSFWKLLHKQRWQEEIIVARKKAEESDKLKTAFLANLSHEIRTPLNGILGFSGLLSDTDLTHDTRNTYIEIIQKSSNQLLTVITDIVEISKLDSGLIQVNFSEVKFHELIFEIFQTHSLILKNSGKETVSLQLESNLKPVQLVSDLVKLRQVIDNLISNAIKYTDYGLVTIGYRLQSDNTLTFFVKDTGIGIDIQHQKAVFERFYQVENEIIKSKGGSGLGLAISKAYVELLGGSITLASIPGKGSTFTVNLPVNQNIKQSF